MKQSMSRQRIGLIVVIIAGIVVIESIIVLLSQFLSALTGPFNSSIIIAVGIAAIIVGASWGIHARFLKVAAPPS